MGTRNDRHLTMAALVERIEAGEIEHVLDVGLLGAVEHRGRDRHAVAQIGAELNQVLVAE